MKTWLITTFLAFTPFCAGICKAQDGTTLLSAFEECRKSQINQAIEQIERKVPSDLPISDSSFAVSEVLETQTSPSCLPEDSSETLIPSQVRIRFLNPTGARPKNCDEITEKKQIQSALLKEIGDLANQISALEPQHPQRQALQKKLGELTARLSLLFPYDIETPQISASFEWQVPSAPVFYAPASVTNLSVRTLYIPKSFDGLQVVDHHPRASGKLAAFGFSKEQGVLKAELRWSYEQFCSSTQNFLIEGAVGTTLPDPVSTIPKSSWSKRFILFGYL